MNIEKLNNYIRDGGDPDYISIQLDPTNQKIWSMVNINLNIPYALQPGTGHQIKDYIRYYHYNENGNRICRKMTWREYLNAAK